MKGRANGGDVILLRSLLTMLWLYALALGLRNLFDHSRVWTPSWAALLAEISATIQWAGGIFAAVYAALYARFASQWTYLSNVYNQIKATECRENLAEERLAQWKAGFIEDAEELHLAYKALFASVIHAWGREPAVKHEFENNVPGGGPRFDALMTTIDIVWQRTADKYPKQG